MEDKPQRLVHEDRVLLLALAAGVPAVLVSMIILWTGDYSARVQWTLSVIVMGSWLGFGFGVRERVASPLRTLANLLEAMREGDYSIRGRGTGGAEDALSDVMHQVNAMSATLRTQRLGAVEATALLRKVMEEIDVAVFAFDGAGCLRLVNRAGERILSLPEERLLGRTAEELSLSECLDGETPRIAQIDFPGKSGRWEIHRGSFREAGWPHQLLVISDLSRALRDEERQAWQRLIRVIGHELNNSLAPIKSVAENLESVIARDERAADWEDDLRSGLSIIAARSDGLARFMNAYARLARLPPPVFQSVNVSTW